MVLYKERGKVQCHRHFSRLIASVIATISVMGFAMSSIASPVPPGFKSPVMNEEQKGTEEVVLRVLKDPRVIAERDRLRKLLEASPISESADGKARLDYALDSWLVFLAFQESNKDGRRSRITWAPNGTKYTWFGHTIPVAGASIDCPDNVYRLMPIDPESSYEIHGQLRPMDPAQFSFMMMRDDELTPRGVDNEIMGVLSSREMSIAADGSFTITVDSKPANGSSNHMQTQPGSLIRILIRDTLSNWLQSANDVTIKRIDGPAPGPALTDAQIADGVIARLPEWVKGWLSYISLVHKKFANDNVLIPPHSRTGGWGYIGFVPFNLADDEALAFTTDDAASEYAGNQITDVWGILLDPQLYIASHTANQSRQNADGTYTYVVAPKDPGTANWLETGGMRRGFLAMRWQGVPTTRTSNEGLVRDLRKVKVSELPKIIPAEAMGVTSAQRKRRGRKRSTSGASVSPEESNSLLRYNGGSSLKR